MRYDDVLPVSYKKELMRIDMDLYKEAFDLIRKGNKTVEMRLNDEKRQKIRVNDLVFFHNCENEYDVLRCKVKRIDRFKDFRTLYEHFDKEALGYRKDEKADPADMYAYYSEEMIKRYGVLAIGIEYLDDLYLTDGHMHLEYGLLNEDYVMRFVQEAAAKGLDEIDILDHSHRFKEFEGCYEHLKIYEKQKDWLAKPTKFCNTLKDYYGLIETMRKKDLPVRVRFGLEVCYTSDTKDLLKEILSDVHLDFLTGAVHSVDHILYDMSFSKELLWDVWPSEKVYRRYYEEVLSLIDSGLFDRLAHPDQIKMLQIDPGYDLSQAYEKIAAALKKQGMYAENNTGVHYRYGHPDIGDSDGLLDTFKKYGVKLICASDAHRPEDVGTDILTATLRNKGEEYERQSI